VDGGIYDGVSDGAFALCDGEGEDLGEKYN